MKKPHGFGLVRIPDWIYTNLKFLYVKSLAAMIRTLPGEVVWLDRISRIFGMGAMALQIHRWKAIAAFARHGGGEIRGLRYIATYYAQWARDRVWCELFFEAHPVVRPHFRMEGGALLQEMSRNGKGGILLGAHYGPPVYRVMFKDLGLDVRQVIGEGIKRNLEAQDRLGLPFLKTARIRAFAETQDNYLARKSEREVLRGIRRGAWMLMFMDVPRLEPGGSTAEFFGRPVRYHDFPFKVALRYGVPVLFCYFRRDRRPGYRLCIEPCGPIASAGEGVRRYASFFEGRIREDPYLWIHVPNVMDWLSGPSRK
jgi:hypothetical protein